MHREVFGQGEGGSPPAPLAPPRPQLAPGSLPQTPSCGRVPPGMLSSRSAGALPKRGPSSGHPRWGLCGDRANQKLKPSQSTGCTRAFGEARPSRAVFLAPRVTEGLEADPRGLQGGSGWGWGRGWRVPRPRREPQPASGEERDPKTNKAVDAAGLVVFFLPSPPPRGPAAPAPPPSDVAEVEIGLLYPPVGGDLLRLVALHVLLHGGEAGAVLQANGALVGGSAVVGPKVFDHGRVVPGALVAQLALEGLLACGRRGDGGVRGGLGPPGDN